MSEVVLNKIEELQLKTIESEKNTNCLVDLFPHLSATQDEVAEAAATALCKIFMHYIENHYDNVVPAPPLQCVEPEQIFHAWMHKNYLRLIQELLCLMKAHCSQDMQEKSFHYLMELVKVEATSHQSTHNKYMVPSNLLSQVIGCLIEVDNNFLTGKFKRFMKYDDIRLYTLKHMGKLMATRSSLPDHQDDENFILRNFELLRQVKMPAMQDDICKFYCGDPVLNAVVSQNGGKALKFSAKQDITKIEVHQHKFSDAWLAFLRLPLTEAIYKQVLISLDTKVMSHLTDPRMLIDFLTDSYNLGGVHSILALNGLFILINEYNLDYSDFYTKLYSLLQPSVFHVKYMPRFFHLLNMFLTSTHLPLYLIAAFCKKISYLLLSAPPRGILIGVTIIVNLMKRHPNCKVLIHRPHPPLEKTPEVDTDPFDADADDPKDCRALESCLWELLSLKSHYCPKVTALINDLLNPTVFSSKPEEDLAPYLDLTDKQIFEEILAVSEQAPSETPDNDRMFNYIRTKHNNS